jgi:hypothetical protein
VPITVDRQIRGGRHTDALIMTDENRQKTDRKQTENRQKTDRKQTENRQKTADKHKNIDRKIDRQASEKN